MRSKVACAPQAELAALECKYEKRFREVFIQVFDETKCLAQKVVGLAKRRGIKLTLDGNGEVKEDGAWGTAQTNPDAMLKYQISEYKLRKSVKACMEEGAATNFMQGFANYAEMCDESAAKCLYREYYEAWYDAARKYREVHMGRNIRMMANGTVERDEDQVQVDAVLSAVRNIMDFYPGARVMKILCAWSGTSFIDHDTFMSTIRFTQQKIRALTESGSKVARAPQVDKLCAVDDGRTKKPATGNDDDNEGAGAGNDDDDDDSGNDSGNAAEAYEHGYDNPKNTKNTKKTFNRLRHEYVQRAPNMGYSKNDVENAFVTMWKDLERRGWHLNHPYEFEEHVHHNLQKILRSGQGEYYNY